MKDGKKSTALVEKKQVPLTIEMLISQAIKEKTPPEVMEKFLLMRREVNAENAKRAFDQAMADFQEKCPVIKKNSKVYEKNGKDVRYKYATIDSIVEQTKDTIAECGLSYSLNTSQKDNMFIVKCKVKHIAGHCEESEFAVPIGTESYMSDVQKYGARSTFAKRYAFCNAFGIMTGDDDTDGNITEEEKKTLPQVKPAQPPKDEQKPITERQIEEIHNLAFLASKEISAIETLMKKPLKDFTFDQGNQWIDKLNKIIEEISEKVEPKKEPETIEGEVIDDVDMANGKELSKGGQIIKDELAKQGKGNIIK